jgi:hypothetical protein
LRNATDRQKNRPFRKHIVMSNPRRMTHRLDQRTLKQTTIPKRTTHQYQRNPTAQKLMSRMTRPPRNLALSLQRRPSIAMSMTSLRVMKLHGDMRTTEKK